MTQKKYKERLIPEQNKTLIAGICLCQLTVVLSLVAFIYLSVAIYMPSYRAFHSGFDSTPVTCQTIRTVTNNNCSWASCGEWCLTKTTGFCPQIYVMVRRNATDMIMENCTRLSSYSCLQAKPETLKRYNCNNGSECSTLTGLFNCSLGHCSNMSELFQCHYRADGPTVDSEKDNMKLNGFFECYHSRCTKIKKPFSCDRYCPKITTSGVNTYIMFDDHLYTGDCQKAMAITMTNGKLPGWKIPPQEIWSEEKAKKMLFASCMKVEKTGNNSLRAIDCVNGVLVNESTIPQPYTNFTTFWTIYETATERVDPKDKYLPSQSSLTIYNQTELFINLDMCVNTLKGECKEFMKTHGRDGRNKTAQSRYPCFYNKKLEDVPVVLSGPIRAIARFDLNKTWQELLIALVLPSVLFVISFTTLMVITRCVKVGDDAILRCQICSGLAKKQPKKDDSDTDDADDRDDNTLKVGYSLPKVTINNNVGAMSL